MREAGTALALFALTLLSMFWVGAEQQGADVLTEGAGALARGGAFALPLMAILVAHEGGHYLAARAHRVEASLPLFLPMPLLLTGTLGALVLARGELRSRNALFDVGAAGPWCGLLVALPVLAYGIASSPVQALDPQLQYVHEGRSLLYLSLLWLLKGPMAPGQDIVLNPVAWAGWSGLLITMINLVPVGDLDGGHVGYALFGPKQARVSRVVRALLLALGLALSGSALLRSWAGHAPAQDGWLDATVGAHWLAWWLVLILLERFTGSAPPRLDASPLSPPRRVLAWLTLLLFGLCFMPIWLHG